MAKLNEQVLTEWENSRKDKKDNKEIHLVELLDFKAKISQSFE